MEAVQVFQERGQVRSCDTGARTAAPLTCWRVCCHERYAKKDLKKLIKNKRALLMDAAQEDKHEFMDLRRCVRAAKMKVRLHSVASVPC